MGKRKPKKPKMPCLMTLSLAVLALVASSPVRAAGNPYLEGDSALRILGGYQDATAIPGTEQPYSVPPGPYPAACQQKPKKFDCPHGPSGSSGGGEDTEHYFTGLGFSQFLSPKVSLELSGWLPIGDAGLDTVSLGAGLNRYFGHVYIPAELQYRGDLDTLGLGTGIGLDFPLKGKKTIIRAQAGPQYLVDTELNDQWTWSLGGSIGWRLK